MHLAVLLCVLVVGAGDTAWGAQQDDNVQQWRAWGVYQAQHGQLKDAWNAAKELRDGGYHAAAIDVYQAIEAQSASQVGPVWKDWRLSSEWQRGICEARMGKLPEAWAAATNLREDNRCAEAIDVYRAAEDWAAKKSRPPEHLPAGRGVDPTLKKWKECELYSQWQRGNCELAVGRPGEAKATLQTTIDGAFKGYAELPYIYRDLGIVFKACHQARQARDCFQKGLEHLPHANNDGTTRIRLELEKWSAWSLTDLGRTTEARRETQRVRTAILQQLRDAQRDGNKAAAEWQSWICDCEFFLAEQEKQDGRTSAACIRLERCVNQLDAFQQPDPMCRRGDFREKLAQCYRDLGRFDDARAELEAADKLQSAILHRSPILAGQRENNWAMLLLREVKADLDAAEVRCDFEVDPTPLDKFRARLVQTETHAQAARRLFSSAGREPTPPLGEALGNLAEVEALRARIESFRGGRAQAQQAYGRARSYLDKALQAYKDCGMDGHDLAFALARQRARLLMELGELQAARREARAALARYEEAHRDSKIDQAFYYQLLVEIDRRLGERSKAQQEASKERRLWAEQLRHYLPGLLPPEQLSFFRLWGDPGFRTALRLGIPADGPPAELAAASAEWLMNDKARLAEVIARFDRHSEVRLQKIRRAIQDEAYILYGPHKNSRARSAVLEAEAPRRLANADEDRQATADQWYTLQQLRDRLERDEVYIDVVCLRPEPYAPRRYYAWVVRRTQPAQVVALAKAADIERYVHRFVKHMDDYGKEDGIGEHIGPAAAEKQLRDGCLRQLSEMLLAPVYKVAAGKNRWIVSLDGPLWNVPWQTFLLPGTECYAVRELTISYVISARDLLRDRSATGKHGPSVVVAAPDINARARISDVRLVRFGELDAARGEGRQVWRLLTRGLPEDVVLRSGKQATKQALLKFHQPRVLYLATHSFFNQDEQVAALAADPLTLCGIAFAGVNFVGRETRAGSDGLPGLMTAAEAATLDLKGTALVVLNTCESGMGRREYGQDPADLRHAFHLAGAQAVISSAWSIEDDDAATLMADFMKRLLAKPGMTGKAEALRRAQCQRIDDLRKDVAHHHHPFYWAAFTLSGQ